MSVPGSNTYPEYTFKCNECITEFVVSDCEENIRATKCISCNSTNVEMLYISFPTDGPGYQEEYYGCKASYNGKRKFSGNGCDACDLDCRKE